MALLKGMPTRTEGRRWGMAGSLSGAIGEKTG